MRCQVQLVIIKQLEHSKGQIKSYVPKSNIVQVKNIQNVPLYCICIGKFAGSFLQQHCHVEFLFKFLDKSVNFFITFCFQKFVDNHQQCFAFIFHQTFPLIIWIFTEGKGGEIESRLPFKIFSTLKESSCLYSNPIGFS